MKRVVSGIVAISLCACSADPGYEPRYEAHESPPEVQPETPPQNTTRSIEAPRKLVAALQVCADRFALKLSKTSEHYAIIYDVKMDSNGTTAKVKDSQFPGTELEKCLTNALERMEIPDSVVNTSQVSPQSRSAVGVIQALAAPIALLPIVLVAGGVTILVGVTIFVAAEAIEALRRRPRWERDCNEQVTACLASDLADRQGSVHGSSRCLMCGEFCKKSKGTWPGTVEIGGVDVSCWY